jgi:hypothetical protein
MKDYKTMFEEVHAYLLKELINEELPLDKRAFINSMLIITDTIINHNIDVFNQVYAEVLEMEEARMN